MKTRFKMVVVLLMMAVVTFAQEITGVQMMGYEQSYLDYEATLALKNETDEMVHNVAFQLVYLDMSGQPMDYKDFYKEVDIEPGMVKKLDIEAYEHSRRYEYYMSARSYSDYPKFKVQFKLKGVNVSGNPYMKSDGAFVYILFGLIAAFVLMGIGLFMIVAFMAKRRRRSVPLWILLSLFITPVLAIFILLAAGKNTSGSARLD